ncbi:MAG: long-chain alkane monooxygenase [Mycobacterium sp.]|nr:long-chain alkane monooxygenase [Mycobacterium sp.]
MIALGVPARIAPVTRTIRFNAFDMNCVAHQSPGLRRHPQDQSTHYKDLAYWAELAKRLERGRFDGLFIADVPGTYDIYGASDAAAIRQAAQIPVNDPSLLVSAMALRLLCVRAAPAGNTSADTSLIICGSCASADGTSASPCG